MRALSLILLCALLLPACLTKKLWRWAGDTYPESSSHVECGMNPDGGVTVLVSLEGEHEPAFCIRVPADWRERTRISTLGNPGETFHSPLLLSREAIAPGSVEELTPAEEEWFLSQDQERGMLKVLTRQGDDYLLVATAALPASASWTRKVGAVIATPLTLTVDATVFLVRGLFVGLVRSVIMWPFRWLENDDDSDYDGSSNTTEDRDKPANELIHPAHGPS